MAEKSGGDAVSVFSPITFDLVLFLLKEKLA
jgi:hypothetical protein